ncbi:hypothetical protein GQ457_09G006460 [Hibiscus cannabinus]
MGFGLFLSVIAMGLTAMYIVMGIAEALSALGQFEFYHRAFPNTMSNIGSSLIWRRWTSFSPGYVRLVYVLAGYRTQIVGLNCVPGLHIPVASLIVVVYVTVTVWDGIESIPLCHRQRVENYIVMDEAKSFSTLRQFKFYRVFLKTMSSVGNSLFILSLALARFDYYN